MYSVISCPRAVFPKLLASGPLSSLKNYCRSSYLAHINTVYLDDRYPKLKICISELILLSCEYIPIALVTMVCRILPYLKCFPFASWV
jgi:hypothetical protein